MHYDVILSENEESDSDLDEEEIENMLEEDFEKRKDIEERDFFIREKEILVGKHCLPPRKT